MLGGVLTLRFEIVGFVLFVFLGCEGKEYGDCVVLLLIFGFVGVIVFC